MIKLDLGLLADHATIDAKGKLYIFGEFRYIGVTKLPARHSRMAVVARFVGSTVELRDRTPKLQMEIVNADGKPVGLPRSPEVPLHFKSIGPANLGKEQAQVILQLNDLVLNQTGDHSFHFFVDGVHIGEILFHVLHRPTTPDAHGG